MAKSDIEAAVAAENTQGRQSEGPGVSFTAPSAKPLKGKLMSRGSAKAGDPAVQNQGTRANRPYAGQERLGAKYGVTASYAKQTAPEAAFVQANGREVSPAIVRQKDSWQSGVETSY